MKITNTKLVSTRGIFLILNFIVNIYLAHRILLEFGKDFFSYYSVLVALPALLPFADLGLGAGVFNLYVDRDSKKNLERDLSKVFSISLVGSLIQVLFFTIFILEFSNFIVPTYQVSSKTKALAIIILVTTYSAVPLSLASKKLQAENLSQTVVKIQGMIPILNLTGYLLLRNIFPGHPSLVVLVPSFSYLLTNAIIFLKSQISRNLNFSLMSLPKKDIGRELNLGFWVIVLSGLTALSWQAPKYFFSIQGESSTVTNYTILLMIGMAAFSLIQLPAVAISPKVRRNPKSSFQILSNELVETFFIGLILSVSLILAFKISTLRTLLVIDNQYIVLLAVIIAIAPFWILPMNTLSFTAQYRFATLILATLLPLNFSILFYFRERELNAVVLYLIAISISFSVVTWITHLRVSFSSNKDHAS